MQLQSGTTALAILKDLKLTLNRLDQKELQMFENLLWEDNDNINMILKMETVVLKFRMSGLKIPDTIHMYISFPGTLFVFL